MPLGLAKAVLGQPTIAAAGATGFAAHNDGQAINASAKAGFAIKRNSAANNTSTNLLAGHSSGDNQMQRVSMVMWYRIDGTSEVENQGNGIRLMHSGWYGDNRQLQFTYDTGFGYHLGLVGSTNAYVRYMSTATTQPAGTISKASYDSTYLDGAWHCVMATLILTDDATNPSTQSHIYHGDDGPGGESTFGSGNQDVRLLDFASIGYADSNDSAGSYSRHSSSSPSFPNYGSSTFSERGAKADLGPIWVYTDQTIDFGVQANRRKFFNPANTDGFVDPGTDGTGGGAPQPELFLYHNGSTLVNGGTQTNTTISTASKGGGAINIIPASEGPGSGDTY